jgi:alpha-ketoglutarate-dependent taurine dioxygenase
VQANEYNGETDENGASRQVYEVRLRPEEKGSRSGRNTFLWHLDGSMSPTPILASLLSAKQIAASGGQTEFCNTYAAYEGLSEEDKAALEGLKVVHANWWLQRNLNPEPTYDDFLKSRSGPSRTQPLVWKHRSGRKSLVLGSTAAYVVGMDPADSMELLVRLRDWATQPQFVYRHEWTAGDLVMWDNTGTLHRLRPFDPAEPRELHRLCAEGVETFRGVKQPSTPDR